MAARESRIACGGECGQPIRRRLANMAATGCEQPEARCCAPSSLHQVGGNRSLSAGCPSGAECQPSLTHYAKRPKPGKAGFFAAFEVMGWELRPLPPAYISVASPEPHRRYLRMGNGRDHGEAPARLRRGCQAPTIGSAYPTEAPTVCPNSGQTPGATLNAVIHGNLLIARIGLTLNACGGLPAMWCRV